MVVLLSIVLGSFSALQLAKVNRAATDLGENWMPSIRVLLDLKSNITLYRIQELYHTLSKDDAEMKQYEDMMGTTMAKIESERQGYAKLISSPEEKASYQDFLKLWDDYMKTHAVVVKLAHEQKADEARSIVRGEGRNIYFKLSDSIEKLVKMNIEGGDKSKLAGEEIYQNSLKWIIILLLVCAILSVIVALWIARIVSRPIQDAVNLAETVAAGDLTGHIEVNTTDETGMLLKALQQMNASLQNTVSQVRSGADTIATASSQIAAGNLDLSSRTEQQASALEETASSMEELTSTVKQNSANARHANELAVSASEIAEKGGHVVTEVVQTMDSISESSQKIVEIISVIDGIAFQTNILALNAAVEAARAGEHGRGFAVVATEVRNLAQRSASAAKEIKQLISDSAIKVEAGSDLVARAGLTMEEIVTSVKRVTDIMGEISTASREQESGIEQINLALSEMDTVTQQNAALVEEAAASASSLQDQAGQLAEVVSIFKLKNAAVSQAPIPLAAARQARGSTSAMKVSPYKKKVEPRNLRKLPATANEMHAQWEEF